MSKVTPTYQAMLDLAEFKTDDELFAAGALYPKGTIGRYVLSRLHQAFSELEYAERHAESQLSQLKDSVTKAEKDVGNGMRYDATWIDLHSRRYAESVSKIHNAIEQASQLSYLWNMIRDGK